jgi:Na+/melibiose symporter-like transporter
MFMILGTIMIPLSVQFAIALPHDKGIAYIGLCAGTFCLIMAMVNVYSLVREEKQEKKDADKREAQRFTVIAKLLIDIRDGLKPKDNK